LEKNGDGIFNDRPPGVPRNSMHGPGQIEWDLNLAHDFLLAKSRKESPMITVALNSFNVLNHPNYTTFVGTITSFRFGKAVSAQPPRRMQLNLQFKF